ncbi:unnamed protein product [Clonostachys rosea]|uniref:Nephrocystin 3-like N-terminal domain-containing protein n=1 Tax=Bionectria ochroleuca TaxID=29856 RepID=A0ABY6TXZ7_BIOOC|nr:unnamed protein product [Clonostachys rosea]
MSARILDTGISVVYEPEDCSPLVDIVIIHGLHGHPYKTWISKRDIHDPSFTPSDQQAVLEDDEDNWPKKKKISDRVFPLFRGRKPQNMTFSLEPPKIGVHGQGSQKEESCVFWPRDLLPSGCPKARVLVFGYDSKVTKYTHGATNRNSVHSHSKDLLFALVRERPPSRRLIFVAHSLGGIVVKEMLAISSTWPISEYQDVVRSTSAVVFLGTPHRGSPELASFGEWARSLISAFRIQTTSDILDALGMRNTDLERAQEAFSALWQEHDFRVKTFQEGFGLKGINLGVLGNKVVPDSSSLIGDYRECAETLQANHKNMCRFFGHDDPNYRKVGGDIYSIYRSIVDSDSRNFSQSKPMNNNQSISIVPQSSIPKVSEHWLDEPLIETEKIFLNYLWFPEMDLRHQNVETPAENTCEWIFRNETYQNWFHNRDQEVYEGLLILRGKPGAGKSVLMKEAFRRSCKERSHLGVNCATAKFFFDAKATKLQQTTTGLFRSLLYQLFPRLRRGFGELSDRWAHREGVDEEKFYSWSRLQLQRLFESLLDTGIPFDIMIFIDAVDECFGGGIREQATFWRDVTKHARKKGSRLSVCLSARHYPNVAFGNCAKVIVEHHNDHDIATYVKQKLLCGSEREEQKWEEMRRTIIQKSTGVFLWVVLVVEKVLRMWDEGEHPRCILSQLETVPESLSSLFSQLFEGSTTASNALAIKLFRWAILAVKPLRLREWHHILAFSKQPGLSSLKEWRESEDYTDDDEQLERKIKAISKGLLEVTGRPGVSQGDNIDFSSVRAGAGSLDLDTGETRVVQVIHQSVCEFFEKGNGFAILIKDPPFYDRRDSDGIKPINHIAEGHLYIMNMALDYIGITELDALVEARTRAAEHEARIGLNLGASALQNPQSLLLLGNAEPSGPDNAQTPERDISVMLSYGVKSREKVDAPSAVFPLRNAPCSTMECDNDRMFADKQMATSNHSTAAVEVGEPEVSKTKTPKVSLRTAPKRPLSEMADPCHVVDGMIDQWISASEEAIGRGSDDGAECESIKTSVSVHTQTLDDHPALLFYVTSEFFTHARLAQIYDANPIDIIKRLDLDDGWHRLTTLREDKDVREDLIENLPSWASTIEWMKSAPKAVQSVPDDDLTYKRLRRGTGVAQQGKEDGPRLVRRKVVRRESVASFSSAGSFHSTGSFHSAGN